MDYKITFDQGTSTFVDLESGILLQQYQATGLAAGTTYKFKV